MQALFAKVNCKNINAQNYLEYQWPTDQLLSRPHRLRIPRKVRNRSHQSPDGVDSQPCADTIQTLSDVDDQPSRPGAVFR